MLSRYEISAEIIDIRILNPIKPLKIIQSVKKTRRLVVVDGGFKTCGFASEIISLVTETIELGTLISKPLRITLPDAPAPTSSILEDEYYPNENLILEKILALFN